jgi:hypothetical protein
MKPAEEYILNQPEPFKSILLHLQILIKVNFPEVDFPFKWKIPFYYLDLLITHRNRGCKLISV